MSDDLVYAADTWKAWSLLGEGERKLRAAKAIQGGDYDDLWLMTLAYLQFKGRKGTGVSQHTLRAYRRGVVDYLIYKRSGHPQGLPRRSPDLRPDTRAR